MRKSKAQKVNILFFLFITLSSWCALQGTGTAIGFDPLKKHALGKNRSLPPFELPMPQEESAKSYLGLSGTENFEIGQIKAQVLIIEVFNFYCPHCQRAAPQVNELYQEIESRPDLKAKIKIIGIGGGNSPYEVNSFKEKYKVPFPLFSDQSMEISSILGVKGTPTFIWVKLHRKESQEQFYFGEGGFQDTRQFISDIIKLSGLKEEAIK